MPKRIEYLDSFARIPNSNHLPNVSRILKRNAEKIVTFPGALQCSWSTCYRCYSLIMAYLASKNITDPYEIASRFYRNNCHNEATRFKNDVITVFLSKIIFSLKNQIENLLFDLDFFILEHIREKKQLEKENKNKNKVKRKKQKQKKK